MIDERVRHNKALLIPVTTVLPLSVIGLVKGNQPAIAGRWGLLVLTLWTLVQVPEAALVGAAAGIATYMWPVSVSGGIAWLLWKRMSPSQVS